MKLILILVIWFQADCLGMDPDEIDIYLGDVISGW
jgi:hypothetical protein